MTGPEGVRDESNLGSVGAVLLREEVPASKWRIVEETRGLAKEFEEIYRPGRPLPTRLPEDSGALRLLQRIRDEAHRFANGYHQLLLKKRLTESILDDCPGVSQNRKKLLLTAFGSIARLRKASVEKIAAVEGIGPKLAEEVHRFLASRT
jgi:excinuclease ABC subunit C